MIRVLSVMALCLSACASKPVPTSGLPSYGDAVPGTIHVIVRSGFERPGHYYLPKGTTLDLLIDVAGWKPIRAEVEGIKLCRSVYLFSGPELRYLMVKHNRGRDYHTDCYRSHLDKKGMPYQHRERLLLDGDQVMLSGISF